MAEGDCVHFCLPGPPDTWSRLLFNHVLEELDWRSQSPSQSRMQSGAWLEYPSSYIMGARKHLNAAEKLQTPWWWPYRTALYTVRGLQTQLKILNKTWCKAKEQLHAMNASEATKQTQDLHPEFHNQANCTTITAGAPEKGRNRLAMATPRANRLWLSFKSAAIWHFMALHGRSEKGTVHKTKWNPEPSAPGTLASRLKGPACTVL